MFPLAVLYTCRDLFLSSLFGSIIYTSIPVTVNGFSHFTWVIILDDFSCIRSVLAISCPLPHEKTVKFLKKRVGILVGSALDL